jgi:PKD repeat protein
LGSDWTVAYATSSYYDAHGTFDHSVPDPDPDPANFHHILLTGLTPNTTYRYQVRVAGSDSPGNSQVFSVRKFQTFPVSGPFTFIVISDTHAQEQRFRYVADALANESGVLFILDGGDYASHDVESQWAYYYGYGDGMLANFTLYTSIGNHEYHNSTAVNVSTDAYEYRNSFVCPLYYSFDCAGVRFVILDSPDPANPNDENPTRAHSEAQASWLKDQLDNTQYGTFVIHHHPVWTVGHASSDSALQSWETLFHSYNISAHFAGHIHTYQRFSVEGIPYFVVANAGGGFVSLTGKQRPSSYVYGATKELGYLKVTVDPANNTATADEYFVASLPDYDSTTGTVISPPRLADTLTFPLKRNVPPPTPVLSAGFSVSPANGTAPQTVKCTDESIGGPTRYNYDFGDGVNVSGSNPGHTYRFPGTYTIKLTVTRYDAKTNSIASNSTTRVITVSRAPFTPPVAKFAASQTFGTVPLTVKFTDQSTGNPTFYTYDFGDGINMTGPNPVHTYRQPGNYTVTLTVMKKDPANGTMVSNSSVRKDFIVVQAK